MTPVTSPTSNPPPSRRPNTEPSNRPKPEPPARPRSARGHGDELRSDLIDAAVGLLAAAGDPEDVSIRAVAKATGVSPAAAYRHFASRDDLMDAACTHCFDLFAALLLDAVQDVDDPFVRLRLAGEAYLRYAEEDRGLYRALFSNPAHLTRDFGDQDSAGDNAFGVLVEMVQACLDAGAPAESDTTFLAFQVWTWIHGWVDLRITHPGMEWPESGRFLSEMQHALGLIPPDRPRPDRARTPRQ